jgi:hypothetical protein
MADHPDPQPVRLEPWLDLAPHLDGLEIVSLSLGPDRAAYVLAVQPPARYRDQRSGAMLSRTSPRWPNTFVVLRCDDGGVERIVLPNLTWNFHFVQPLPDAELLLVCARTRSRDEPDADLNAQVFGRDGAPRRSFRAGDGINDVQATAAGRIWASYFDEGVFGHGVGHSGLNCWDAAGQLLYAYDPPAGLREICDCYALNVSSKNEAWFYYYTEFRLVRLLDKRVAGWWDCSVRGAHGFAVNGDIALMTGGYRERDIYHLLELGNDRTMRKLAAGAFFDVDGAPLDNARVVCRADQIILLHENRCYRTDVAEVLVRLT